MELVLVHEKSFVLELPVRVITFNAVKLLV
jgi:hypothetical protein